MAHVFLRSSQTKIAAICLTSDAVNDLVYVSGPAVGGLAQVSKADIIVTTSSAYGPTGPMARYVGFDGVGQAMSGAVYMTGEPGQPYRAQVPWVDFGTALHCAFGTLAALMERAKSGRGQPYHEAPPK